MILFTVTDEITEQFSDNRSRSLRDERCVKLVSFVLSYFVRVIVIVVVVVVGLVRRGLLSLTFQLRVGNGEHVERQQLEQTGLVDGQGSLLQECAEFP